MWRFHIENRADRTSARFFVYLCIVNECINKENGMKNEKSHRFHEDLSDNNIFKRYKIELTKIEKAE